MLTLSPSKRKWWVLAATSGALAMIFLDQSALPIALPSIQRELSVSQDLLTWVINAYLLTIAVLIILGGELGDRLGHRNVFLGGMLVFISASIACAMSPTAIWLIVARILQGVGAAVMMPASSPLFRTTVDGHEFGKMAGLYVAIASVFLIIGPPLGGFLTAYLSWRWIFWVSLPIALVAALIIILVLPPNATETLKEQKFDKWGFLLLTAFLMPLVFGLMQGQALGWASPIALGCFAVSLLALLAFIRFELRQEHPFVDLKLFKNDCFSRCVSIIAVLQIVYASTIFWALFLQYSLSLSPEGTGMLLLVAQAPVLISSPFAGRLLDRFGPKLPVMIGTGMTTVASLWMAIFSWQQNFWWLFPALVVFGLGSPMVSISVMSTVISSAEQEKRGITSGIISAARQVGGSVGLAVLVAIVTNVTYWQTQQWLTHASGALAQLNSVQLNALLAGKLPTALSLTAAETNMAHIAAVNAYTQGFSYAMLVVALVSFLGFFIARKLPHDPKVLLGLENG